MYSVEEFDNYKTKVLKYIMYKKRSEYEIRNKFIGQIEEDVLDDIIQYLKDTDYINDTRYIDKTIREHMSLKNLSIKELIYKLCAKGISKGLIEEYTENNQEMLNTYEQESIQNIIFKKQKSMDQQELKQYLFKKGYKPDNIDELL